MNWYFITQNRWANITNTIEYTNPQEATKDFHKAQHQLAQHLTGPNPEINIMLIGAENLDTVKQRYPYLFHHPKPTTKQQWKQLIHKTNHYNTTHQSPGETMRLRPQSPQLKQQQKQAENFMNGLVNGLQTPPNTTPENTPGQLQHMLDTIQQAVTEYQNSETQEQTQPSYQQLTTTVSYLRQDAKYWRTKYETLQAHIEKIAESVGHNPTPPEPPIGTRYYTTQETETETTTKPQWEHKQDGWHCTQDTKTCKNCPVQWEEVREIIRYNQHNLDRCLPGETP